MRRSPSRETLLPFQRSPKGRRRRARSTGSLVGYLLLGFAVLLLIYAALTWKRTASWRQLRHIETATGGALQAVLPHGHPSKAQTIVTYVFSGTDPEYEHNLRYFLRTAVEEGDGCDYVIVIQTGQGLSDFTPRPPLPPNAKYVEHENKCFDWGTFGWVFERKHADFRAYRYYIWLNSSARGPFLPAYLPPGFHWSQALTSKITDTVKLVGPTINCGGGYGHPPVSHIQTYAVATDQDGMKVLIEAGMVFHCWENIAETVIHSELGASLAIKKAGFNLGSLMLRYQGLDWRDERANACNGGLNPIQSSFNDGINVDPLEVLFVKVKGSMKAAGWPHVLQSVKYDEWSSAHAHHTGPLTNEQAQDQWDRINKNEWQTKAPAAIEDAKRRGAACFDVEFYVNANKFDLWWIMTNPDPAASGFGHYITSGLNEGRPVRFTC